MLSARCFSPQPQVCPSWGRSDRVNFQGYEHSCHPLQVTGGLVTQTACEIPLNDFLADVDNPMALSLGAFYAGDSRGLTASVISLMTNVVATSLVGYKAW